MNGVFRVADLCDEDVPKMCVDILSIHKLMHSASGAGKGIIGVKFLVYARTVVASRERGALRRGTGRLLP